MYINDELMDSLQKVLNIFEGYVEQGEKLSRLEKDVIVAIFRLQGRKNINREGRRIVCITKMS